MKEGKKCPDIMRWDLDSKRCISCPISPGFEVTRHCGYDDDGNSNHSPKTQCKPETFNDGSGAFCKPCSKCAPGHLDKPCTTTADTICFDPGTKSTRVPATTPVPTLHVSASPSSKTHGITISTRGRETQVSNVSLVPWVLPLAILLSIALAALLAFIVNMKRKRGQHRPIGDSRRSSYDNPGFTALSAPAGDNVLEDIINQNILSAPLQTVLDNLDVLEELVILLDPESPGIKNTKHLASLCSFPSTWTTYAYSMKESKSPLKALLEGVTSRNPDWTVGHLAKLLRHMERNDAIAALSKIRLNVIGV
ncbi:IGF-like family receptor 1 isoform X1 [Stegastes partitus]|nr:PREDICTED: IGF-like family receptor 1 isoform X1 [Stegastes partitus]